MDKVVYFNSVSDYNTACGLKTLHPLISIIDLSKCEPRSYLAGTTVKMNFGIYAIFLKDVVCGDIRYGRNYYDYQEGTLVFIGPGQSWEVEYEMSNYQPHGHVLLFHPDLIHGTSLGKIINDYNFFSYQMNEALHLSDKERHIIIDCFAKIQFELQQTIDKHSKKLISANIELLINYCERFYDRQFITRDYSNKSILERFEQLIIDYFNSDKPQSLGLPSVGYCAEKLNLSANYFGDLIKKETGISAQEHIQSKIIQIAKEKIFEFDRSISEIAFNLGFKYPQHFTRLFKQKTGMSPMEYRSLN
ncbi:transcriptional regulator [Flavobacterium sp. MEB061]|jgi:AraC-like DNA-binding protein|uniref:helix-turn-helix domain-containing protein n=1 Tax=Flavobacterium sp. MEB061 TaxID=1587524 RepID=UPI0005AC9CD3|nr:helix-turn-helix domain-containing protein [Flavobacterium sp. MEB061]KIQ14812.1 transcriptional regulator [Flavobacterium sp. MEB061]